MVDVFQWRIQDFPRRGGANLEFRPKTYFFDKIIIENYMKMKEIGPRGADLSALLGSADALFISGICKYFFPDR